MKNFILREIVVLLIIDNFFFLNLRDGAKQKYWSIVITFRFVAIFIYRGMTFAVFNVSGYIPVLRNWSMIKHSGLISAGARNFKSRVEIPS